MTTKFHIDVINQKLNHSNNIKSLNFTKYAVLYFTTTYLYLREPFLQMKELLIMPLKRDFNCSLGIVVQSVEQSNEV